MNTGRLMAVTITVWIVFMVYLALADQKKEDAGKRLLALLVTAVVVNGIGVWGSIENGVEVYQGHTTVELEEGLSVHIDFEYNVIKYNIKPVGYFGVAGQNDVEVITTEALGEEATLTGIKELRKGTRPKLELRIGKGTENIKKDYTYEVDLTEEIQSMRQSGNYKVVELNDLIKEYTENTGTE